MPERNGEDANFERLSTVHKSTVHRILDEAEVKPFRIRYHCENRDPDFDSKMHNVLLVHKQLSMQFDTDGNLRVHTSKETRAYLATAPGRFEFVFTPKHGSWLNMIEGFFSKMTRQMLRGIRVGSKKELEERIHLYFDEVNAEPVVHRWRYRLDDVDVSEEVAVDTLLPGA